MLISWSLSSNGSTCYIAASLRIFVPNNLQAYSHVLFSKCCACNVWLASPSFPVPQFSQWLLSNYSHCSILKATHTEWFPNKLQAGLGVTDVPSTSVYSSAWSCIPHHLSRWLPCTGPSMRIGNWAISPSWGLDITATMYHPHGSPHSSPVSRNEFWSSNWPASGVGGITVDVIYMAPTLY
jgi:hypothetical protein